MSINKRGYDSKVLAKVINGDEPINVSITGSPGSATSTVEVVQDTSADLKMTEVNSGAIKTAVEAVNNAVDGNYLNVNLNLAGSDIAAGAGVVGATVPRVTLASDDPAVARLKEVAGQDFLCITDASAHTGLDCTMIYVMNDAVFSDITVASSNIVAGKGLTSITVIAGTLLPFGKVHATAITLTSGKVIAYIN